MDVIEPTQTEWGPPIVCGLKKDGSLRSLLRGLPETGHTDDAGIPDFVSYVAHGRMYLLADPRYNTFDFGQKSRYWQVHITEQDSDKTAFASLQGLVHFTQMIFGLKNTAGTFRRAMAVQLTNVKLQLALVCSNDIVIVMQTPEDHINVQRCSTSTEVTDQCRSGA